MSHYDDDEKAQTASDPNDMHSWGFWDWMMFWGFWALPIGGAFLCAVWSYASYHVLWLAFCTYIGVLIVGCGCIAILMGLTFLHDDETEK